MKTMSVRLPVRRLAAIVLLVATAFLTVAAEPSDPADPTVFAPPRAGDPPTDGQPDTQPDTLVWDIQHVETKLFENMEDRSLRLDATGHPHIAYGGDHLYYA